MPGRKPLTLILSLLFVCAQTWVSGQDTSYTFGDVEAGTTDSLWISLKDHTIGYQDVYCHFDAFELGPKMQGADSMKIYFTPESNIAYKGVIVVTEDESFLPGNANNVVAVIEISGNGRLNDPYYTSTFNLTDEALKDELHNIIDGHTSLGYSPARDEMFMQIDNWKNNGRGAASNTLEGAYTGQLAVGYSSRQDAQTNYNFNTEHTFPQGTFNSDEPMRSDLHHLFPTKVYSNSERGNKPFGMVNNPSWQEGGSRSNSTTFEPRDQQKGPTARAMLYFLLRYQNYQNYVSATDQEVLMDWAATYAPDSIEKQRNEDIYQVQNNRNPLVDHPQFLDRIHNFTGPSQAPENFSYSFTLNDNGKWAFLADSMQPSRFAIVNTGNVSLEITDITSSQQLIIDSFDQQIAPGRAGSVFLYPKSAASNPTDTLIFEFQDNRLDTVLVERIFIQGISSTSAVPINFYPNPATDRIQMREPLAAKAEYFIYDLNGRLQQAGHWDAGQKSLSVAGLNSGYYLIMINDKNDSYLGRIAVSK